MRKLAVFLFLIFMPSASWATDYYFATAGSNSNPCTQVSPCQNFKGKLDGANALNPGDHVYFNKGDEWKGSNAEVVVRSNGTADNYIIIDAYGTGANPLFNAAGNPVTSWTLHSGAIYKKTLGSGAEVRAVGVDKDHALGQWYNNTSLASGTWHQTWGNPNVLYIRLSDDSNPSGHDIYVATTRTSYYNLGTVRTYHSSSAASYVRFQNLAVYYSADRGFTSSGRGVIFSNVKAMGNAMDGVHFEKNGTGEDAQYSQVWDSEISWNNSYGGAGGYGQGFTTYSPYTWVVRCTIHDNFMAGADFLDFSANTNVTQSGIVLSTLYDNGRFNQGGGGTSYDANIYVDGGSEIMIYGNILYGGGTVTGATNAREGIKIGSEHPISKPAENIYIINNFVYKTHWVGIGSDNANQCSWNCAECLDSCTTIPSNVKNVYIINNTVLAYDAGTSDMVWTPDNNDDTADNWVVRNNIFIGDSLTISHWMDSGTYLDSDYNLFYRRTGNTNIYSTNGGSTNYTLATWRTLTGEDANSLYGNPYIVTDSDTNADAHLQRTATGHANTSPAIDVGMATPYTPPNWIPADISILINAGAVVGTTRTDLVLDDVASNMDLGFHYQVPPPAGPGQITAANVEPASLTVSVAGNVTISGTCENDIPSDGKFLITFPTDLGTGFTFDSGGTTTASFASGGDGSLAVTSASNVLTLTRSGGTTLTADTAWSITATNIQNPSATGSTNVYAIETRDSSNATLDINQSVDADTITPVPGPAVHFSCSGGLNGSGISFN